MSHPIRRYASSLVRERSGQSLVLVVIALPVLIGMAGISLSAGTAYYSKTRLQSAADAAALAGAQAADQANGSGQSSTAANSASEAGVYAVSEDYAGAATQISVNTSSTPLVSPAGCPAGYTQPANTVAACTSTSVPAGFAGIFGYKDFAVNAVAAATLGPGPAFDYALFQGSNTGTLSMTNGGTDVTGNIHSNNDIDMGSNTVSGTITATGTTEVANGTNYTVVNHVPYIPMPQWTIPQISTVGSGTTVFGTSTIPVTQVFSSGTYSGNYVVYGNISVDSDVTIDGSLESIGGSIQFPDGNDTIHGNITTFTANNPSSDYYHDSQNNVTDPDGSIVFQAGGISIYGYLVTAEGGNIDLAPGGVPVYGESGPLVIASMDGSILFGGGQVGDGIVYAPKGNIQFSYGGAVVNGAVVGETLTTGGGGEVTWNSSVVNDLPAQLESPVLIQ